MPSHPRGSNNPPQPPRAVCGDPRAAGVGVRLTYGWTTNADIERGLRETEERWRDGPRFWWQRPA